MLKDKDESDYSGLASGLSALHPASPPHQPPIPEGTPLFTFSLPDQKGEKDLVFYLDLTLPGAQAVVTIVAAAFVSHTPVFVKVERNGTTPTKFVSWVQGDKAGVARL